MKKHASRLYSTGLVALLVALAMLGGAAAGGAGTVYDYGMTDYDDYTPGDTTGEGLLGNFPNIEPTQVVDEENINLTLLSIDYSSYEYVMINYEVESTYEIPVTVQMWEFSINGYMINASCSSDVAPGEKKEDVVYIQQVDLDLAGIKEIADMQLQFTVFDSASYDDILITDYIQVSTGSTYMQTYDDSGIVLYDKDEVKIVMKPLDYSDSLTGPRIPLYIENNSDVALTFSTSDLLINGKLIDDFFIVSVSPGKRLVAYIEYFETPKRQYGIEEFENIEFNMYVSSIRSFEVFFSTGNLYVELDEK
ncbi:MAG: hypothetical protein AB1Z23_02080 [Eubacteriales bacterium]